jgi:hypothetical protein
MHAQTRQPNHSHKSLKSLGHTVQLTSELRREIGDMASLAPERYRCRALIWFGSPIAQIMRQHASPPTTQAMVHDSPLTGDDRLDTSCTS